MEREWWADYKRPYMLRLGGEIYFRLVGSQWRVLSRGLSKSDVFLQGTSLASLC